MTTFIKGGIWSKRKVIPKILNGELNLDEFVENKLPTPTYKVFTALLTQSGGDFYINNSTDSPQPFIVGVTYYIDENNSPTANFTNIGAPNNNVGTYFIATGTTPQSWGNGEYVNLRYNTGAPVATVLENTIGNVWFTFQSDGEYYANSNSLFTDNKTATFGGYYDADLGVGFRFGQAGYGSINQVFLRTNDGPPTNGLLQNATIEIRLYN